MRTDEKRNGAWAMAVALAIDSVGTGLYIPLSMIYFLTVTHLSEAGVGLLLTAATAVVLPVPLVTGRLVDRLGARPVVIAGLALQAAGFFLYLGVRGPVSLLLSALVETAGLRVYWSSILTLVAEQAGGRATDGWFARAAMIRAAGMGAGTVLAGGLLALASQHAYQGMVLANGVSFVVAALTVGLFVPGARPLASGPDRSALGGVRQLLRDRPYLGLIGVNTLFCVCTTFLAVAVPVYVIRGLHAPGWTVGVFVTITTVAVATCTGVVTRLSRRRLTRPGAMMAGGLLWVGWCVATALAVLVPRGPLLVGYLAAVMLLWAAADMLYGPGSNALSAEATPPRARGTYLAAFQYSFAVANMVTPGLFGVLYELGRTLPWLVVAALALLGSLLIRPLERRLAANVVAGPAGGERGVGAEQRHAGDRQPG